jgi:Polysaccharide lyase family 4, domain II
MPAIAYPYQAEEVRNGGTINGFVKYEGKPPSPVLLAVTKDRDVCGSAPVYDQSLVVGPNGGIANAVVTITNVTRGEPLKPAPAVSFDQKQCRYIPHVAVFPAGSTVLIVNSDGILHNIHTESTINPVIDLAQPGFKKQIRVTIRKPEIIKVTCDAHNWMEGWWYVTSTPYYAVTDSNGRYAIQNIPPGAYELKIWQERLGTEYQRVVIKPGAVTQADFILGRRKSKGS